MTDATEETPRRIVRVAEARRAFPALSAFQVRRLVKVGAVRGYRPHGSGLLLLDLGDLERVVLLDGRCRPEGDR